MMQTYQDVEKEVLEQVKFFQRQRLQSEQICLGYRPYGIVWRYFKALIESNGGKSVDTKMSRWLNIPVDLVNDDDLIEVIACLSHDS